MAIHMNSERGSATLDRILFAADACNHAIPTSTELNGALSKLLFLRIVEESDDSFRINSAYISELDAAWEKPGGLFDTARKGLDWLQANWPDFEPPRTTNIISSKELNEAYKTYRASVEGK